MVVGSASGLVVACVGLLYASWVGHEMRADWKQVEIVAARVTENGETEYEFRPDPHDDYENVGGPYFRTERRLELRESVFIEMDRTPGQRKYLFVDPDIEMRAATLVIPCAGLVLALSNIRKLLWVTSLKAVFRAHGEGKGTGFR